MCLTQGFDGEEENWEGICKMELNGWAWNVRHPKTDGILSPTQVVAL